MNQYDIVTYTPYSDDTEITSARKGVIIATYADGTADISLTAQSGKNVVRQGAAEAASGYNTFTTSTYPGPGTVAIPITCSDLTTNLTTGTGKAVFRAPFACTVRGVRASLATAQAAGSIFTVDVNESGTSILSTKLTIDNGEKTSTTAATPAVVSDTAIADDAEITVDIDQVGTALAKGLVVTLYVDPA